MKKIIFFIFLFFSFFMIDIEVYNAESLSVANNDYELVCVYDDGTELTISRDDIYMTKGSNSLNSNSNSNITFYLSENQKNEYDSSGNLTKSNVENLLRNKVHCPNILYIYKVLSTSDKNVEEDEALEDVYNFYYSTKSGIKDEITGTHTEGWWFWEEEVSNGEQLDEKVRLKSEEINLLTSKETTICDYKSKTEEALGSNSISLYLYDNITILETNSRTTPLWDVQTKCPIQTGTFYLNDPMPKSVGSEYSGNYQYNYWRYSYASTTSDCQSRNNNKECTQYEYVGSRNGAPDSDSDLDPCKLLGNDTIMILKEVIGWLQILVPALVIILIGVDITKMVLSGNMEEELPKKKKSIIFRLIIMLIFFFAPLITTLIIDLLNDTGVINVGDISCLLK